MFNFRRKEKYVKPDYSDGRNWDPLNVEDGRPRLLLTADNLHPNEDGSWPVHIDFWNGMTWENASEALLVAQRIVTENTIALARAENVTGAR